MPHIVGAVRTVDRCNQSAVPLLWCIVRRQNEEPVLASALFADAILVGDHVPAHDGVLASMGNLAF